MNEYSKTEIGVGFFVIVGGLALGYVSISLAGLGSMFGETYVVEARFSNVGSLEAGAPVQIAGVPVGQVDTIELDGYIAVATLEIRESIELPKDTMASIQVAGLLGNAHVALAPGSARDNLKDGDRIDQTEPAINITELIGKYAFGSPTEAADSDSGSLEMEDPLQ